jgi:anti-anti-sigma factor
MPEKIEITSRNKYGYLILDIKGVMEPDSLKKIESYIEIETGSNPAEIIFNLENVEYISSSATYLLAEKTRELALNQKIISLLNVNSDILGILSRQGLKNFFKILPDEDSLMGKKRESELDDILDLSSED